MAAENFERNRMIFDIPSDVQMAIRLRAAKSSTTTGAVVSEAVNQTFGREIEEARAALAENQSSKLSTRRKRTG